jgi:putative pyruvate formate lyase activating enzyme
VVTRNLLRAADRARLLVRHLVMPGHVDCCLRPVTQWMAAHLPEVPFSLHTGYVPAFRAGALPGMDRCLTARERSAARDIVARAGVRLVEARATGPTPVPLSIGGAAGAATCP